MKKHGRKYAVVYGLLAIFAALLALAPLAPSYKACATEQEKAEPTRKPDDSGPEFIGRFTAWKAFTIVNCEGEFFHHNEGIFTAISTIFIAMFTLTLWRSTERLWATTRAAICSAERTSGAQLSHGRDVNRAYLGAGGDFPDKTQRFFNMDFENNGKTPAFILSYDVHPAMPGQVSTQSALTVTEGQHPWSDTIPPWGRKSRMTTVHIPRGAAFVYGCVWYQDVWRTETRRSRFILSVDPLQDRTLSNVNAATVHPEYFERT